MYSGAEINVLPYQLGINLGFVWDDSKIDIRLGGNLSHLPAIGIIVSGNVVNLDHVRLVFAWVKGNSPLILGQTNFFSLHNICFYQEHGYFEIATK